VLYALRHLGDGTADEVAGELAITASGARQHLVALADVGLVAAAEDAGAAPRRGRPSLRYHVTELADALFPKAYAALANELLGYLDDTSGVVDELFARRRDDRITRACRRLEPHRSLGARIAELASLLDEDGYMASVEQIGDGHFRLVEHNCAIADVARRYGQACTSEIEFFRAVLPEAVIERTSHMVQGARHCAYDVRVP
jgi:predicted ArsR family transcriptional regulator